MGINERKRLKAGSPVSYNSVHLSRVDLWIHDIAKPDVCFFEVSRPDEDGYMNFGPSGTALHDCLKKETKKIIVQVNSNTPYVLGENNKIHVSEVDAIVEADWKYDDYTAGEPDEIKPGENGKYTWVFQRSNNMLLFVDFNGSGVVEKYYTKAGPKAKTTAKRRATTSKKKRSSSSNWKNGKGTPL